jgi:two-component system response regulator NreC
MKRAQEIISGHRRLSYREEQVLILATQGYKNREIAEHLGIAMKTVETHRSNIMNKLALTNLAQLIHFAIREGYITIEVER